MLSDEEVEDMKKQIDKEMKAGEIGNPDVNPDDAFKPPEPPQQQQPPQQEPEDEQDDEA